MERLRKSGGSGHGRLRDLLGGVQLVTIEFPDERGEIGTAPDASEALLRVLESGGNPTHEHPAVAPAAHVADEVADEAVEILDRVRAAQRPIEGAGHAEALQRERLGEALAERRGRAGVRA